MISAKLDALLSQVWETEDGRQLAIRCMVVDAGGQKGSTDQVWAYTGPRNGRGVYAIMGRQGEQRPIVSKPSVNNRAHVPTFYVGTHQAKNAVLSHLLITDRDAAGYWQWPDDPATGYDAEYFQGLLSERRVEKTSGGRTRIVWVQSRHRNEPWDLAQYSVAAFSILDPDLPALAKRQAARAKRARPAHSRPADALTQPQQPRPPQPPRQPPPARRGPPRRRILSRGIR